MRRYNIAGLGVEIGGEAGARILEMDNFIPFCCDGGESDVSISIEISHNSENLESLRTLYRLCEDGVDYSAEALAGGEFGYIIRGGERGMLSVRCNPATHQSYIGGDGTRDLLLFGLWLAYGCAALPYGVVAIHASTILYRNRAVLFLGESGTGKSTHTRLWRESIEGSELLNDDSPLLRIEDERVYIYGSPWSGKIPCYRNERYEMAGAVRLSQHSANEISRHNTLGAFTALYPSAPPVFSGDESLSAMVCEILSQVIKGYGVWHLRALPDSGAAMLSCSTIFNS